MSKYWTPAKKTVDLGTVVPGSRIRRAPVPIATKPQLQRRNRERELWLGAAGIVAMASACAALAIGVSNATSQYSAATAASGDAPRFRHCYNGGGADCVVDGDTIYVERRRIELAFNAPEIRGARCEDERRRGIEAANALRAFLNTGEASFSAEGTIAVDGQDVATLMTAAGKARPSHDERGWC